MRRLEYSKDAVKYLSRLDSPTKQRIKVAVERLAKEPLLGDIKVMSGYKNRYRLRVGDWRILFSLDVENLAVIIHEIKPRGDAYKRKGE